MPYIELSRDELIAILEARKEWTVGLWVHDVRSGTECRTCALGAVFNYALNGSVHGTRTLCNEAMETESEQSRDREFTPRSVVGSLGLAVDQVSQSRAWASSLSALYEALCEEELDGFWGSLDREDNQASYLNDRGREELSALVALRVIPKLVRLVRQYFPLVVRFPFDDYFEGELREGLKVLP